jgi:AcrR family transcriptional regulator
MSRHARRRGGPRRGADAGATRGAVFAAAADAFSRRGFDGVTIDDIAAAAGVNKAMIYYHFTDKLALYRDIVCEMLDEAGARVSAVVAETLSPTEKLRRFIAGFIALADSRPYFPPLMMREISEGALHLDAEILARMRNVFQAFARVLAEGEEAGVFRRVHPVLAYMSVMGPVLLNAARERAAAQPGRAQLPMFVRVPHDQLTRHMQHVAISMLEAGPGHQAPGPRPQAPGPRPQAPGPRPQAPGARPQAPGPRRQASGPKRQPPGRRNL